jgi:hypothetical protein
MFAYLVDEPGQSQKCVRLNVESFDPSTLLRVIAGLDPAIQKVLAERLDCRVTPGNDTEENVRARVPAGHGLHRSF